MKTGEALGFVACAALLVGCSRKDVAVPAAPAAKASQNSYIDLRAGSMLRIVMPLLKSGGFVSNLRTQEVKGNVISVTADDFIGYVISNYAVAGRNGVVKLKFVAGQQTKEGRTVPLPAAPELPFALPRKLEHVRLIYLVRVSQADHNMAIVASKHLARLEVLTARLKEDSSACTATDEIFCTWVPAGIAVRPEK